MKKGIWKYSKYLKMVGDRYKITLGEGDTPITCFSELCIKREDKNPTGSYKDRGVAYKFSKCLESGETELVTSSTGNLAISALTYGKEVGITVHVFVTDKISDAKKQVLEKLTPNIYWSDTPIKDAEEFGKRRNILYMRQSSDQDLLEGFKTLIFELYESGHLYENIVFPIGSGSFLLASFSALRQLKEEKLIEGYPRLIGVQGETVTYVARHFTSEYNKKTARNIADSFNVKLPPLNLNKVVEAIKFSKGTAIVVSEEQIIETRKKLARAGIETGYESAAAYRGAQTLLEKGEINNNTLVIATGKDYD